MAQSFFQPNPDTGQPFTLDEALKVGMPQQGGLSDILVNRQGVGGQMFGNSEPTGLAGMLGQQVGPQFDPVQGQSQPRKPNMLKNIGMGLVGGALDGVARWGGAQPGYANALEQQQAAQQRLNELRQKIEAQSEQSRLERLTGLQDFQFKEQYKRDNQGPTNAARMLIERGLQPGTPRFEAALAAYMERPIMANGEAWQATPQVSQYQVGENGQLMKWVDDGEGQ